MYRRQDARRIGFSAQERADLLFTAASVSLVFALVFTDPLTDITSTFIMLLPAFIFGGLGVLIHELAHKYVAVHKGFDAIFVANKQFSLVSIGAALFGFILLAPGGVHIAPRPSKRDGALIALAGPASNIVLALIFLPLSFLGALGTLAVIVNAFLALFNMLPFPGFDGNAVFGYAKLWGIGTMGIAGAILLAGFLL